MEEEGGNGLFIYNRMMGAVLELGGWGKMIHVWGRSFMCGEHCQWELTAQLTSFSSFFL